MKAALHIWITALIIQPIIYIFIIGELAIFVVPVEIFGSIPGLVLFWIAMWAIATLKIKVEFKWALILLSAFLTALFCNYLFFSGNGGILDSETLLMMMPAPVAAVMGVVINCNSVNKLFTKTQGINEEPYSPANMEYQNDVPS